MAADAALGRMVRAMLAHPDLLFLRQSHNGEFVLSSVSHVEDDIVSTGDTPEAALRAAGIGAEEGQV